MCLIHDTIREKYRECAHPYFISSGHACAKPMQRHLGVSTFPGTREKQSPLTVYDPNEDARHRIYNREIETPKVGRMDRTIETRTRTGRSFPSIDRGVSDSLMPRISVNHEMTTMPLSGKTCDVHIQIKDHVTRRGLKRTRASRLESLQIGPGLES
ncbi:hypothetical protein CRG98_030017 [Punica granatum]|uniref:Uncharacterized protein n=1 Tax=Punica granatum TaxID=22663 RepID=A0A2I0J050_PUNGR|nr:hypothetical protein CRG98_030017 [Punica granatum]